MQSVGCLETEPRGHSMPAWQCLKHRFTHTLSPFDLSRSEFAEIKCFPSTDTEAPAGKCSHLSLSRHYAFLFLSFITNTRSFHLPVCNHTDLNILETVSQYPNFTEEPLPLSSDQEPSKQHIYRITHIISNTPKPTFMPSQVLHNSGRVYYWHKERCRAHEKSFLWLTFVKTDNRDTSLEQKGIRKATLCYNLTNNFQLFQNFECNTSTPQAQTF